MVLRSKKHNRKYLGMRSWGAGNIKNRRGAGDRGGVGRGGKKHKWTWTVKYDKESIGSHGFTRWGKTKLDEINLDKLSAQIMLSKDAKPAIVLPGYKVLSSGTLKKAALIKATAFSAKAAEKIKQAGGEAVTL